MKIKLMPFITAGLLLASGLSANAEPLPLQLKTLKLRALADSLSTVKNPEEEKKSIAEELFGMVDKGETYKLSSYSISPIEVNGVDQKFVINNQHEYVDVDELNPDGSVRRTVNVCVIHDFYTKEEVLKHNGSGDCVVINYQYFAPGDHVVFGGRQGLIEYVEYSETLTAEQKAEIKRRCEREQTIEEVAETLLMIDPNIKGWHTLKPSVIVELGTIPNNRQGELVWDTYLGATYAYTESGEKICLFLEMYEMENGDLGYREALTKRAASNIDLTVIDPDFARDLNIVSIEPPYYLADFIRDDEVGKTLVKFINDAKVEKPGEVDYDMGKLPTAYAQLPEEYKIDFSKLMNGASKYFFYVDPVTGRIFNITASSEEESDKKKSLVS